MIRTARALLTLGAFLASASVGHAGGKAANESFPALPVFSDPSFRPVANAPAAALAAVAARPDATTVTARGKARRHRVFRLAAARDRAKGLRTVSASPPSAPAVAPARLDRPVAEAAGSTTVVERSAPGPAAASEVAPGGPREAAAPTLTEMLARHAHDNGVPVALAEAVVRIESRGNARASHGGALGLMQIKPGTARSVGFNGGAGGLLDPEINLRYGMKVLGAAYKTAGGDVCRALMQYQSGHLAAHMNRANRVYCSKARAIMAGA